MGNLFILRRLPVRPYWHNRFIVLEVFTSSMKLESLDLNLLLVFDALATERSVTQAAAKIGLSQPALSNALARLRILFRDPLFERGAGQMQPTPRARQLLAPLSEAIAKLREKRLRTQAAFLPEASEREFLIATNDYVDALLLPSVVRQLQRDAPSIAVCTVPTDYLFLPPVERLQAGELDLALGFFGKRRGQIPAFRASAC